MVVDCYKNGKCAKLYIYPLAYGAKINTKWCQGCKLLNETHKYGKNGMFQSEALCK